MVGGGARGRGGRGTESHLYLLRRPHDNKRTEVRRRLTVPQSRHHSEEGQKLHAASQPVQLCVMSVTWGIIFCFLPFLPSSESQRWVVQLRDRSAWPRHKAGGRMRAGPSLPAMPGFTRLQERVPPTRHIIGRTEMNDSRAHEGERVDALAWLRPGAALIGRCLQPGPGFEGTCLFPIRYAAFNAHSPCLPPLSPPTPGPANDCRAECPPTTNGRRLQT